MDYIVLITVILLNTALFIVSGAYGKKERFNSFLFTSFTAVMTMLFFAVYNKFRFRFDAYTVALSLVYSVSYVAGMAANVNAMKYGSVALTSMIASFSLLLPTAFGIIYWKEPASPFFLLGLVLFCLSLVLTKYEGKRKSSQAAAEKAHADRKRGILWTAAVSILFFTNGFSSILSTFHQKTGGENYRGEFMVISMTVVLAVNLTLAIVKLRSSVTVYIKDAAIYGTAYGLLNAGIRLGVMILSTNGVIGQSVFYPVISVGVIVLVFAFSVVFFKEKFRKMQYVGVALGVASIVLLQM